MSTNINDNETEGLGDRVETLPPHVEELFKNPSLDRTINQFCKSIDSLAESFAFITVLLRATSEHTEASLDAKFSAVQLVDSKGNAYAKYTGVDAANFHEFDKLRKRASRSSLAFSIVPQSLFVSLISQFDAFIGNLVRNVYGLKPELLNASNKQMTYADLVRIGSVSAAREMLVEKEIDEELRGSHTDLFKWLEKFSNTELISKLRDWKAFIEHTERRNLFVHTGGTISRQYIDICKKNGISIEGLKIGDELTVSSRYFQNAYECIFETGLISAQIIWRQLFPKDLEQADSNFNEACMEIIQEGKYKLACNLLDYADQKFRHDQTAERIQLMLKINRAQAYKWAGDEIVANQILNSCDWTAKSIEFNLAASVLRDDYQKAARIMRQIGNGSEVRIYQSSYSQWPLFKEFRKSEIFLATFEEIFGTPFIQENTAIANKDNKLDK